MPYRIKLSDGVDTVNLYDGSDSQVREGGMGLPPPAVITSFIGNPAFDGNRLARSRRGNRQISMSLKIVGSSLSDLKDNIRTINRLLNDAEKRNLSGYGSQLYLEYQWADNINESVFYDVLRGDLSLPGGFQSVALDGSFTVLGARLTLICEPFGRYIEQDIAQDTLENSQSAYEMEISFLVDDGSQWEMDAADDWEAMSFTTTGAFTAVGAAIKCFRGSGDTLGDITFALYAVDGTSRPTGSVLATGTVTGNNIHDLLSADAGWLFAPFDTPVDLGITEYALVIHGTSLAVGAELKWRVDGTAGFANGQRSFSTNGGGSWTADGTDDFLFAIFSAETDKNYQEITTDASYGDVPSKLFLRLSQSGATGTEKVWIAKRSGLRYTDNLWIEGESASSSTDIVGGTKLIMLQPVAEDDISGGMHFRVIWDWAGGTGNPDVLLARVNFTLNNPPRGQFRVLMKARSISQDTADFDHIKMGFGWSYGDKTFTPTDALGEYYTLAANNAWEILDLGVLNLPPIAESDILINNSFELRIFYLIADDLVGSEYYHWDIDYIFLLPIDEGVVILDAAAADVLAIDGITGPSNVFKIDSSDRIVDFPSYVGSPFLLGRESTRIYVLRDDVVGVTFASDVKYQPRFQVT